MCYKLSYGVNIFDMHHCHVTLEYPKPKHVENFQRSYGWSDFDETFTLEQAQLAEVGYICSDGNFFCDRVIAILVLISGVFTPYLSTEKLKVLKEI